MPPIPDRDTLPTLLAPKPYPNYTGGPGHRIHQWMERDENLIAYTWLMAAITFLLFTTFVVIKTADLIEAAAVTPNGYYLAVERNGIIDLLYQIKTQDGTYTGQW